MILLLDRDPNIVYLRYFIMIHKKKDVHLHIVKDTRVTSAAELFHSTKEQEEIFRIDEEPSVIGEAPTENRKYLIN